MKTLLFLLFSAFPIVNAFSQNPADSLRDIGELENAVELYRIQYQNDPADNFNTYNYACALSLTRNVDSAFHYLDLAIANDTNAQAFNDADFYFLLEDPRWDSLQNVMIERIEKKYGVYENVELTKELWTMKIKDQAFYYHVFKAKNEYTKSAIWELKTLLNNQNLERLEEIIETYGWPTISMVKGNAAGTVFLIIQHADLETQKKYLPVMRAAADKGEANWSSLALLIDRIEIREGRKQIYGSQIIRNEDGSFNLDKLIEPEYVNQRRLSVGLGPIEDYVSRWDIEWTIEQKTKEE